MNALFRTIRTNQALHEIGLTSMVRGRCFFKQCFDLGCESERYGGCGWHVMHHTLRNCKNQGSTTLRGIASSTSVTF